MFVKVALTMKVAAAVAALINLNIQFSATLIQSSSGIESFIAVIHLGHQQNLALNSSSHESGLTHNILERFT